METCHAIPRPTSPRCETDVRPSDSSLPVLEKLRAGLDREHFLVIDQIWQTFRVPASGIGLIALAHEIARDLSLLSRILPQFSVPEWSNCIGAVIPSVSSLLSTDATRDLSALLNLPRQSLRYFLAPIDKHVPVPQARLMRALRVLLSLGMLAGKEELATKFAQEFARWLAGDYPANLQPDTLNHPAIARIAANQNLRPDAIKILNHLASTLRSELPNPFEDPALPKDFYSAPKPKQHGAPDEDNEEYAEISGQKDILQAAIAAQATATRRQFSGVPTFECMHPFELELLWPKVIGQFERQLSDEAFAAETALFLGVTPPHFHLIELQGNGSGGHGTTLSHFLP